MGPDRRGVVLGLGASWTAGSAMAQPNQGRTLNGLGYMRAVAPPALVQRMITAKDVGRVTNPVMEQSETPEVRGFRDYVERVVAREKPAWKQLERLNAYVNQRVKQVPDTRLYDRLDQWAPPLNTLLVGGDCEDLALLKRWALLHIGFRSDDIFLVCGVTHVSPQPTFHAILGVLAPPDKRVALLDNLSDTVQPSAKAAKINPVYVLNPSGLWRIEKPVLAEKPYWDDVALEIQPGQKPGPLKLN